MAVESSESISLVSFIMSSTLWPMAKHSFCRNEYRNFRPVYLYDPSYLAKFSEQNDDKDCSGMFPSKKVCRDIMFFSRMEWLILEDIDDSEEIDSMVEKPVEILFDDEFTRVFVPDFIVFTKSGKGIFIVLTSYHNFATQDMQRKAYALNEYCKEKNCGWCMIDIEKKVSLKWLMRTEYTREMHELENIVRSKLESRKWLNGSYISKLMDRYKVNYISLQRIIIRNGFLYQAISEDRNVSLIARHQDDSFESQLIEEIFRIYDKI